MNDNRLKQIRQSEKESHIKIYTENKLYAEKGWLSKPIRTVLDIIPLFDEYKELRVLDLGAGVGRNCLPFAQRYRDITCRIDCIDILELATQLLLRGISTYSGLQIEKDWKSETRKFCDITFRAQLILCYSKV